jgi:hypothetical protein
MFFLIAHYYLVRRCLGLAAAPLDKNGWKILKIPLGASAIDMAQKAITRLNTVQVWRKVASPNAVRKDAPWRNLIPQHKDQLYSTVMQNGNRRSADCVFRDSYTLPVFYEMCQSLWLQKEGERRTDDIQYRDLFCITARHNMLLRDEDLRHFHFSDCFSTIVPPQKPGGQQIVGLTFKTNQGKTNKLHQNWYACTLRHEDVRRCSFSAFAFYMFQLWQVGRQ